jgi:alpha-1,3-glucosyltransferase
MINRGWPINPEALTSASRGLIGETTFGVLPEVTPVLTFSITLSISLIFLTKLWFDPTYKRFLDAVVLSAFTSFLWGWHVHEKAVLLFLVPLRSVEPFRRVETRLTRSGTSLTAVDDDHHFRVYTIASCAGIYSLFPLLIKPAGKYMSRLAHSCSALTRLP